MDHLDIEDKVQVQGQWRVNSEEYSSWLEDNLMLPREITIGGSGRIPEEGHLSGGQNMSSPRRRSHACGGSLWAGWALSG